MKTTWKLCEPVKNSTDLQALVDYLQTMYETLAMVNYPFESDFLMPLPANPVRVACQYLTENLNGTRLFEVGIISSFATSHNPFLGPLLIVVASLP